MFSYTVQRTVNDQIANLGGTETVQADSKTDFDGTVAGSASPNVEIDRAFTRANLKLLCFLSDKALTIYTNAASDDEPQDTIAVPAGQALVWTLAHDGIDACPFSADVTKLYVTVTGTAAAALKVRALSDETP